MAKLPSQEISWPFQYELKMILYMASLPEEDRIPFLLNAVENDQPITVCWVSATIGSGLDDLLLENAAEFFIADILYETGEWYESDEDVMDGSPEEDADN